MVSGRFVWLGTLLLISCSSPSASSLQNAASGSGGTETGGGGLDRGGNGGRAGNADNGGRGGSGGVAQGGPDTDVCGRWFDARAHCGMVASPPQELARQRARFQASCAATLALPGSGQDMSWLSACIAALEADGCDAARPPSACRKPPGKRASGAPCNDDAQCLTGVCNLGQVSVNASVAIPSCGTCVDPTPEGQACDGTSICAAGTSCNYSLAPDRICQAFGDVAASCGALFPPCRDGLTCFMEQPGSKQGVCTAPGRSGEACAATTCLPGLACDPVTKLCVQPTAWAKTGEPCDDTTLCEVGLCVYVGPPEQYRCGAIDADGHGCTAYPIMPTSSCDTSTSCVDGQCTLTNTKACP